MRKRGAEKGKYACAGRAQSLCEVYVTLSYINGNSNSSTVVKFSNISSYENVFSNWKCVPMILSQLYLPLEARHRGHVYLKSAHCTYVTSTQSCFILVGCEISGDGFSWVIL
jgi:hypothetical protein